MPTTVMLVDDDPTMSAMLHTLLQMEGFTPLVYQDAGGEDIIQAVKRQKPDTLLLDVNLRRGSGLEILKQIRSDSQLKRLQVLMTSGMELSQECERLGADGFLLKPYMPEELLAWLRRANAG